MDCELASHIGKTDWRENHEFVLVSGGWLLTYSFGLRGWEQQSRREKLQRDEDLQMYGAPAVTCGVPDSSASPCLLRFLVEVYLVTDEVCLSGSWILCFFFTTNSRGKLDQHCRMQINRPEHASSEAAGQCLTSGRCFKKTAHLFCEWGTNQKRWHPLQWQYSVRSRKLRNLAELCWEQPLWGGTLPANFSYGPYRVTKVNTKCARASAT